MGVGAELAVLRLDRVAFRDEVFPTFVVRALFVFVGRLRRVERGEFSVDVGGLVAKVDEFRVSGLFDL